MFVGHDGVFAEAFGVWNRLTRFLTGGAAQGKRGCMGVLILRRTHLEPFRTLGTKESTSLAWALVDAGADVNACDDGGSTPLDLARSASRQTAARELVKLGARENQ